MGLKVKFPNAFTIHKLGVPGGAIPFPFGVSCYENTIGVFSLYLHPISLVDIGDFFKGFETVIVFNVAHSTEDWKIGETLALSELATNYEVDFRAVDTETIVISGEELEVLLVGIDHYDFHAFDVPKSYTDEWIIEGVSAHLKHKRSKTNPLLPHLPNSDFFLYSHDDCSLHLDSYDVKFLKQIFERAMQIYAGTVLIEESNFEGEIAGIPKEIIDTIWPMNSGLTIFRALTEVEKSKICIGISQKEFNFREAGEYPVDFFILYDYVVGEWRISR
jgi:hypothetical protein